MEEKTSSQEKKQEWFRLIAIGLIIILIGTLLSIIWLEWAKIGIYDKHLKLVSTNALWSIILLLLLAVSWLWATTRKLKKRLEEKPPQNVILLPQKIDSVLENYDKHENGYFIHKKTKKPFCPRCLAAPKYYENELTIEEDNFWCESCNYHKPSSPSDFYPDNDSGESPLNTQF